MKKDVLECTRILWLCLPNIVYLFIYLFIYSYEVSSDATQVLRFYSTRRESSRSSVRFCLANRNSKLILYRGANTTDKSSSEEMTPVLSNYDFI